MKITESSIRKIILAVFVLAFSLTNFVLNAESSEKVVKIGVYENPPKIYTGKNGKLSGFHADLIREIAKENNWKIEFIHGSWNEQLDKTESGEIDVMVDVAFSEKRLERFDFNRESVFLNWGAVYSRRGFQPQTLFELDGKRVAGMEGGVHTDGDMGIISLCREFRIDIDLVPVPDYLTAFEMVNNGEADVAVVNRIFGKSYGQNFDINRTPIIFNPVSIRYAFPKNTERSRRLISEIDSSLMKMKENNMSAYYKLLDKYLAGYIEEKTEIPVWLLLVLTGITVLLLILVILFSKLRVEIKLRQNTEIELRKAKTEADAANRAKSVFLASMTHEIRTPMNAILGYSELLQKDADITSEQRNNLKIINNSGEQLLSLINEVLDMSRIEADRITYNESNFNISGLLQQTVLLLKPEAAKKDINILFEVKGNFPAFIKSDEQKIRQIMLNLLSNAVKYSDTGAITITAEISDEDEHLCLISVSDTGRGISKEYQDRIFNIFERGDNQTTSITGVGLGLAISKKYAEFLGGSLRLERSGSLGSTFIFCFRFSEGTTHEIPRIQVLRHPVSVKSEFLPLRLLIVDDRDTNRDILEKLLAPLGFTLRTAKNGIECINIFKEWSPDCVLMDIVMPEMNGIEAVRAIRNEPDGRAVKLIALSASAMDEDKQGIIDAGADTFMYKPYRESQLLDEIARLLSIEYEYEEILSETETESVSPQSILLPGELKEKIIQCAKIDSRSEIIELMEHEDVPPDLKKKILRMADSYQFLKIIELFDTSEKD